MTYRDIVGRGSRREAVGRSRVPFGKCPVEGVRGRRRPEQACAVPAPPYGRFMICRNYFGKCPVEGVCGSVAEDSRREVGGQRSGEKYS